MISLKCTPVAGTWAWQTYGINWVQLDAPRHLWIPSLAGMQHLVQRAGLSLQKIQFDSDRFQIIGSEKIKRGQSFHADAHTLFSPRQLRDLDRQVQQLNADNRGDQACFWLRSNTTIARSVASW